MTSQSAGKDKRSEGKRGISLAPGFILIDAYLLTPVYPSNFPTVFTKVNINAGTFAPTPGSPSQSIPSSPSPLLLAVLAKEALKRDNGITATLVT